MCHACSISSLISHHGTIVASLTTQIKDKWFDFSSLLRSYSAQSRLLTSQHLIKFSFHCHPLVPFLQSLPRLSPECIPSTSRHFIYISTAKTNLNQPCFRQPPYPVVLGQHLSIMCHFRHFVKLNSFPQQWQLTHINPVHILCNTDRIFTNVPLHAFCHIRFYLTVWTIRPISPLSISNINLVYIFSIFTKSLLIMCQFRNFVLLHSFPHQGQWDKY